jgi:hypothetical protein
MISSLGFNTKKKKYFKPFFKIINKIQSLVVKMNSAKTNFELLVKSFCHNTGSNFKDYVIEFHGCYHQTLKNGQRNGPLVAYHPGTQYRIWEIAYYKDDKMFGRHKIFSFDGELLDCHEHTKNVINCRHNVHCR